jgi:hypothetical protein
MTQEDVAAAFSAGDKLPDGSTLAVCGSVYSWHDLVATLNALGHDLPVDPQHVHADPATRTRARY